MMAPKEKRAEKSAMNCRDNFSPETKQQLPKGPGIAVHFPVAEHQPLDPAKKVLRLPQT
jgi:hypothetical protein